MIERLSRIVLLFLCFTRFVVSGKANKKNVDVKNIVIIPTGKLGDIVCATPVFQTLRKHIPLASIYTQGTKINKDILSNSSLVDIYIPFNNIWSFIKEVYSRNIDIAIVTGPSFSMIASLYVAGIPFVVAPTVVGGFSPSETRPYKILRWFIKTFPFKMGEYAPRERLRSLEPLNIFSSDTTKHLGFSKTADKKISQFFVNNGIDIKKDFIVGISPSAGNKMKNWGEKKFAELSDYIYEKYSPKIIIIGSERDKEEVRGMVNFLNKNTKIINTLGMFNIDELKALISKMNIFVAVDTGPIYIAEAFNVATVDIVGPVDDGEQPPTGERHKIVKIKNRIPEVHIMNAGSYDIVEARRQTDGISVPMVIEKFNELVRSEFL